MSPSFTLTDRPQPRWLQFVIQAVSVPVLAEVLAFGFLFLGSVVVKSLLATGTLATGALVGAIGFFLGLSLRRIAPSLRASGRWIWIPAVLFFAVGVLSDLWTLPKYYGGVHWSLVNRYFCGTGDDEGTAPLFATYPVYSAAAYSLAMFLGQRKNSPAR
jgi:hypothetical protein